MSFDLRKLIDSRWGENYELHERHLNPQLVRVLQTIGFDKIYRRGEGAYLYDDDGNAYLDFLSGYGVFGIGRNHPVVKKTIEDALSMDLSNMVQMDCALLAGLLAEKLVSLTAERLQKVFFTNSGTEAVEGALKLARGATGRERIVYTGHAFHGLTLGSLSANGCEEFRGSFGELLSGTQIPFNDLSALEQQLCSKDVAAFIVEPIQGKGVHIPDNNYLPDAQALCRKYGTMFVLDEIQTGLGRTGKMFAHEHWGVEPDLMTIAKALSGGLVPVGAVLMSDFVYKKVFSNMEKCVIHSTTFGRNQLAMAAGLATLNVLEEEKIIENAAQRGTEILNRLREQLSDYEMFSDIRGMGLMIAIEFKKPKSLKLKMAWKAIHAANGGLFGQMLTVPLMEKHRILTQIAGHNMDVIKLLPTLVIGEQEVTTFCNAFEQVVAECHRFPGAAWEVGMGLAKKALKKPGSTARDDLPSPLETEIISS
jgi:acetylornithine/succinyldiaminopimelate/putrescine aminotransferase